MEETKSEISKSAIYRKKLSSFLFKYYLPISYIVIVIFGALVPQPGAVLDHKATQYVCVISIFVISGLYLHTNEMKDVFVSYKGAIFGIVSILAITPIIGGQLTLLLDFSGTRHQINKTLSSNNSANTTLEIDVYTDSPIGPLEYKYGLIVFFSMPCSISTGVIMISQMNGHVALALFLTVVANVLGIFTVPLFIKWLITSSVHVKLDLTTLISRLCLTLLLPLVVGKLFRLVKQVREFIKPKKPISKILSITFLDILIWVKISTATQAGLLDALTITNALFIVGWATTLHVIFLILNAFCCWVLRLSYEQKKAIIILSSQKTLAVAIPVVTFLPASLGDQGIMVIAMVLAHLTIIVFDSVLVSVWLHIDSKKESPIDIELTASGEDAFLRTEPT